MPRDGCAMRQALRVEIPIGIAAGAQLQYEGEGHRLQGREPGNVIVHIREKPHQSFRRKGNDLHYKCSIFAGSTITINTLGGDQLRVSLGRDVE
jgi:DnaJ-class molecular chaperone